MDRKKKLKENEDRLKSYSFIINYKSHFILFFIIFMIGSIYLKKSHSFFFTIFTLFYMQHKLV